MLFSKISLKSLGSFLTSCTEPFLEVKDVGTLTRIYLSYQRLLKDIYRREKIGLKIIKITPSIYGIAIAFCPEEGEKFNEKHILRAIQKLIPGIKPVAHSFINFQQKGVHFFYLEIIKMRGGFFSIEEKNRLNSELLLDLKRKIENDSYSFFLPGNEEELFKNIRHLSQEIKFIHDIPHAMIKLVEYSNNSLKFLVIVVRVVKPTTETIVSQSANLPSLVRFFLESVFCVGRVRKKYPKEASVFTLEVKDALFLRDHETVNMRASRQYISKTLEAIIGPFRDYNGGLLIKENEQLLTIRGSLERNGLNFSYLEDLLYGIRPITTRMLVSTETITVLISLFQEVLEHKLTLSESFVQRNYLFDHLHAFVIKTTKKEWKTLFPHRILSISSHIGYTSLEHQEAYYLFFFQQFPEDSLLKDTLEKEIIHFSTFNSEQQKSFIKINFQSGDPPTLNPRLATDIHCHILSSFLFEGLTRINSEGNIEFAAAEKVEISNDRLTYIFSLRPSYWSNGEQVTAFDFEKSWKKSIISNYSGIKPDSYFQIKNAEKIRHKTCSLDNLGVIAKDAVTLIVELEFPCPFFLNLLATPAFFPLYGEAEEPRDYNGPFMLAEWKEGSFLSLNKNPFYWGSKQIKLEGIKILMIRDPYIAYQLFQAGELDLIGDPISPLPPDILKDESLHNRLHMKEISRIFWIHCNLKSWPLNNLSLRKALSLALNRKRLVEKVFIDQTPHLSPLPPRYATIEGNLESSSEIAKKYFEQALVELNIDRKQFPKITLTHSDLSFDYSLREELRQQWKEILGIDIVFRPLSWYDFSSSLEKGDFQLGGMFRRDLFSHPLFYLGFFKNTPHNAHGWDNEEYEKLLQDYYEKGHDSEIIKKIESLIVENIPVITLVNQRYLALIQKRVKGIRCNENGCIELKGTWIDEKDY